MNSIFDLQNYFFNPYALPHFLAGVLVSMEGIFIFTLSKKSITHTAYLITTITAGIWLTGVGFIYSSSNEVTAFIWSRHYTWFGIIFITPAVYLFSATWYDPLLAREKAKIIYFNYFTALVFYIVCISTTYVIRGVWRYPTGFFPKAGLLEGPFIIWFYTLMIFSFGNFVRSYRKEKILIRKKNTQLMTAAFSIAFFGSVEYLSNYGIYIPPIAYFPMFLFTSIMGYCVIRYKLMEIETVIHKTVMWLTTSFLFAIPVLLFAYFSKSWLLTLDTTYFMGITLGLIVLFGIYARFVQPRIDHLFQRRRRDLARVFEKFTDELVHLRGLEELTRHIVGTIRGVFYVEEISLLLARDENSAFESVKSLSEEKRCRLERTHPFAAWLEAHDVLVLREYVDLDPRYESVKKAAKEYFEMAGGQVCLPLVVSQRLLGIINIGRKANLKRFEAAEINFLSDLRRTAAIALSNSLRSIAMQESLRRWNVELEKKVEERTKELQDTQAQLIQAEKLASIGTLAGGIAHEINNPLTAVLTNVQMLKMLNEGHDAESLSLIEEGAKRCQQIIQKLMRYARKTDEVQAMDRVDVNKSIQTICDFLGYQLKQENIDLELSLTPVEPVAAIAGELEQVFTNLILNAKDAIRSAGRKGTIRFRTEQKDGWVIIQVSDNGIGIKKENLVRVFDPFFTTKDVGEGTGLGLTVSSGIVEKHRGKISVTSQENQGTAFTIQFPAGGEKPAQVRS